MKIFEPIYTKVLQWAKHRHATKYLASLSFAESSFFPIPVDVILAPMVLSKPTKWWFYAAVATVFSVLGGMFGYFIGAYFFDAYGTQLINMFHAHEKFEAIKALYKEHGLIIILMAGLTPLPYKIFTIASGVIGIALLPFVLMSLVGRGLRFFLVAGLTKWGGEKFEDAIKQKIELIGWLVLLLVVVALVVYKSFL